MHSCHTVILSHNVYDLIKYEIRYSWRSTNNSMISRYSAPLNKLEIENQHYLVWGSGHIDAKQVKKKNKIISESDKCCERNKHVRGGEGLEVVGPL